MTTLIRRRKIVVDDWLRLPAEARAAPAARKLIVPLALWRERSGALLWRRRPLGVWLDAHDDPADIAEDLWCFEVVALAFDRFSDGRAYSSARLLRGRHGWRGELRAIGDIGRDQLLFLERVGFDAFELREGADPCAALAAFCELPDTHPAFRRRRAA